MKKLIALVLIQNFVIGQIQVLPEDGLDLFNNMMKYLFDNCRLEFGTIGFWGTDRIFLADDEVDIVLLNDSEVFRRPPTRRIKFLVNIYGLDLRKPKINIFHAVPTPEIETVFVFDKGGYRPWIAIEEFEWYQKLFQNCKVYYCFELDGRIFIVTLNSFADVAPVIWKRDSETYAHINPDDSVSQWWTYGAVYNQETKFDCASSQLCKNIFFDRTEKLNGYTIKASARLYDHFDPIYKKIDGLITKASDITQLTTLLNFREGQFTKALADYLNVSIEITHGMPVFGSLHAIKFLITGYIEIDLTATTWSDIDGEFDAMNYLHLSYPYFFFYEQIVTHNRGLATPLEKMFEFYGWLTVIVTLVVFLTVFIVIYLSNRALSSRLSFSFFECLRLLISNSICTRMESLRIRIFFSVIFLYFLIIQATFSGHLAAFLTKPVYRKNVETLDDLEDYRYSRIYARSGSLAYINGTSIFNKTVFNGNCEQYINDTSVACIDAQSYLKPFITAYNLHTPKNFVKVSYTTFTMTHNSAIKHRVNNLLMRLAQSGIANIWTKTWQEWYNETTTYTLINMEDDTENYHRPIELEDLIFAFYLLGIGLFFANISFILEKSSEKCALNKKKINLWSSIVKRYTIFIVRFVIFEFHRLLRGYIHL